MIYPNTSLKYQVVITAEGFSQDLDPWKIIVRDKYKLIHAVINKNGCIRDSEGGFYFILPKVMTGIYDAITTVEIPDDNYAEGYMLLTDKQELVKVGIETNPCVPDVCPCHDTEGLEVTFTRVFAKSIDDIDYLVDSEGNYITTSEGKRIRFVDGKEDTYKATRLDMTGEQFKQLVEGTDPNGEVNTLPEVMNAMTGIGDDTTVKEETDVYYDEEDECIYVNGARPKDESD